MLGARLRTADSRETGGLTVSRGAAGRWRVALIDGCGRWPGALCAAAFSSRGGGVEQHAPGRDPTGHGTRIANLLTEEVAGAEAGAPPASAAHGAVREGAPCELLLAQVFSSEAPATAAAVAAAIDWAVVNGGELLHMSIGLAADRAVLAAAVRRALAAGCIIVASTPARGRPVFPASYADVIRATGDARCASGEISILDADLFGGCPRYARVAGSSIGAAWVSRHIVRGPKLARAPLVAALRAGAQYVGRERRVGGH